MTKRRWFWLGLWGSVCALAAVLLVPYFSADRFRPILLEHLQRTFQSPVELGEVRFTLWGGPGFQLKNVVISDVDALSAEPFAYVGELWIRLGVATLWKGDWVVSRITLVQPSLNIARGLHGDWNYARLLHGSVGESPDQGRSLPEVQVEGGRINFREGLRKSVYYFRNADLRIADEGIGGDARLIEFRAEPARTDSYAPRFGTVHGHGRWRPGVGSGGDLDLDVGIERSPVPELAALLGMPRAGLSGYARALAHLSGPAESLSLRGSVELQEQSEWPAFLGFLGWREGRGVSVEGTVNLPARRLSVRTVPSSKQALPLPFSASLDLFPPAVPEGWQSSVEFEELPIESLQEIIQRVDDTLPMYPQLKGTLTGRVDYRSDTGVRGRLRSDTLLWQMEDTSAFSLRSTSVDLDGDTCSGETRIVVPQEGDRAETHAATTVDSQQPSALAVPEVDLKFQANRSTGQLRVQLNGGGIGPQHLAALETLVPEATHKAPLLDGEGWDSNGTLLWHKANYRARGSWSGSLRLRNLIYRVSGFRVPIHLDSGMLDLRGANWSLRQMKGNVGKVSFQGEIHHQPSAARPYQLALYVPELDLHALDAALPLNSEETRSFFQRTFSRKQSPPAWMKQRAAVAKLRTGSVFIGEDKYSKMKGDLYWDGESLEFRNIAFGSRFGVFHGAVSVNLSGPSPLWTSSLVAVHPSWESGVLKVDLRQRAHGGLLALFESPQSQVDVVWEREEPDGLATTLRAELRWPLGGDTPEICEHCVELRNPDGVWMGFCGENHSTGYRCLLTDPQRNQQVEVELPISMVGGMRN